MAGRKRARGKAKAPARGKSTARPHTPTPRASDGPRVRSRFAGLKFYEPPSREEVERIRQERKPGPWGLLKPGQWASALCGCAGPWVQKGDGLYWRPTKSCEAHALMTDVPLTPPRPPGELVGIATKLYGELWPLPCRLCGAQTHAGHRWDCVFWAINDRTPFDGRRNNGEAQHDETETVEAGAN